MKASESSLADRLRDILADDTADLETAIVYAANDTASSADRERFDFILGGCQYPAGLLDDKPAHASYRRLAARLKHDDARYLAAILTGDQVYIDVTAGLFDPTQLDDTYRRSYERWLHKLPVRQTLSRLPLIAMLDDHEIHDNWEPVSDFYPAIKEKESARLELGVREYRKYQRSSGPGLREPQEKHDRTPLWCDLEVCGLPVFLADTRTERKNRNVQNIHEAKIMDDSQLSALKEWLSSADPSLPKIIVSPSILLPRHTRVASCDRDSTQTGAAITQALLSDSWDGYPCSLYNLLAYIAENQIGNVVFVSGDEHIGCAARAVVQSVNASLPPVSIHSIHTSALYAPYPFANAVAEDFISHETFEYASSGKRYRCTVDADFYPGEGFTLLSLFRDSARWRLHCEFEREDANRSQTCSFLLSE